MQVASLGSGSRGNGTLIEDGDTCLLVDLGFSVRETVHRLERLDRLPSDINAVLVTHEHSDHIGGVLPFILRFDIPVFMTAGTRDSRAFTKICEKLGVFNPVECFSPHKPFTIGGITIEPVAVPHDASEPCQFVFSNSVHRVGLLTDTGYITPHVQRQFQNLDVLLLESNYDPEMLDSGPYPYRLKHRISGSQGHLSNAQAASLLAGIDIRRLQHLVISHISEKNNLPGLVTSAITEVLDDWRGELTLAGQDDGTQWITPCG